MMNAIVAIIADNRTIRTFWHSTVAGSIVIWQDKSVFSHFNIQLHCAMKFDIHQRPGTIATSSQRNWSKEMSRRVNE